MSETTKKKVKSPIREWFDSILFAVVAATLIRWLILEAYTIPTGSMEKTLLINDFLFVSKLHYGTRSPMTPLQVPLTHQKIWGTEISSYLDWFSLPYFRFPGFSKIKNNDVVVFNYPGSPSRPDPYGGFDKYPVDLRTNYVKRCIGLPGDVVQLKNTEVLVNNRRAEDPKDMEQFFDVESTTDINPKLFKKLGLENKGSKMQNGKIYYVLNGTHEAMKELGNLDFVTNIAPEIIPATDTTQDYGTFPQDRKLFKWSRDNWGPLTIPKKGMTVPLDAKNIALYKNIITTFDGQKNAEFKDNKIFIDGVEAKEYTFNQNYYFMLGDNRFESDDSRYWGLVPEDHIVGKAAFIWMSYDKDANLLNKIRWQRLFKVIK